MCGEILFPVKKSLEKKQVGIILLVGWWEMGIEREKSTNKTRILLFFLAVQC